ncbi:MAG: hypothetical protein PVI52_02345 [Chromatiales bacterium]|jgi:hypothetical protein
MDKKIFFWVLSLSLLGLVLAIMLPGRHSDLHPKLPWDIKLDGLGGSEIFGLTLDKSTLNEARETFGSEGKISLFVTRDGKPALEAYFERVFLSGLRADIVLVMDADADTLQGFYDRGSRISRTTDITHKIDLASADQAAVGRLPIGSINYIPAANLDDELVLSLFGEPDEKIKETATGVTHWIYPERGLSIGTDPEGKEMLQYVAPRKIDLLIDTIKKDTRPSTN